MTTAPVPGEYVLSINDRQYEVVSVKPHIGIVRVRDLSGYEVAADLSTFWDLFRRPVAKLPLESGGGM